MHYLIPHICRPKASGASPWTETLVKLPPPNRARPRYLLMPKLCHGSDELTVTTRYMFSTDIWLVRASPGRRALPQINCVSQADCCRTDGNHHCDRSRCNLLYLYSTSDSFQSCAVFLNIKLYLLLLGKKTTIKMLTVAVMCLSPVKLHIC